MRFLTKLMVAATPLLVPAVANASPQLTTAGGHDWTIQAFANGHVIQALLTGAKGMLQPGGVYSHFIMFIALVGVMSVAVAAAHRADSAKKMIGAFLAMFVFVSIGLNIKGNVIIEDTINHTVDGVTNVPAMLFVPAAVVSTSGHLITKTIETFYSLPDSLKLTTGGTFNIGNSLIAASTKITVTDPLFRQTLEQFSENCIIPSIASGRINAFQMITSTNIFATNGPFQNIAQSPLTTIYTDTSPGGVTVTCGPKGASATNTVASNNSPSVSSNNALNYIQDYFAAVGSAFTSGSASAFTNTGMYSFMSAASLGNAQTQLMNGAMSTTGSGSIEQSAAINALRPAMNAAAVASGNSAQVTAMAVSEGEQTQKSNWGTAAIMFQDLSGYLYSVLQAFLIALTPMILAALFIPGAGKKIVVSYFQVTVWLALWEPMLSIINYIVDLFSQGPLGSSLGGYAGYTMMNVGAVSTETANLTAAAGFLAAMVPMITWGLVKGGIAFTEFLTQGMGGYMARSAASAAATGNITLDNQSFHNRTLDQMMMRSSVTAGVGSSVVSNAPAGADTVANLGAGQIGMQGGQQIHLQKSLTASEVSSRLHQKSQSESTQASEMQSQADRIGYSHDQGVQSKGSESHSGSTSVSGASGTAANERVSSDESAKLSNRLSHDLSVDQMQRLAGELGLNASKLMGGLTGAMAGQKLAKGISDEVAREGRLGRAVNVVGQALDRVAGATSLKGTGQLASTHGDKTTAGQSQDASTTNSHQRSADLQSQAQISKAKQDLYQWASEASGGDKTAIGRDYAKAASLSKNASELYTESSSHLVQAGRAESLSMNETSMSQADYERALGRLRGEVSGLNPGDPGMMAQGRQMDGTVNGKVAEGQQQINREKAVSQSVLSQMDKMHESQVVAIAALMSGQAMKDMDAYKNLTSSEQKDAQAYHDQLQHENTGKYGEMLNSQSQKFGDMTHASVDGMKQQIADMSSLNGVLEKGMVGAGLLSSMTPLTGAGPHDEKDPKGEKGDKAAAATAEDRAAAKGERSTVARVAAGGAEIAGRAFALGDAFLTGYVIGDAANQAVGYFNDGKDISYYGANAMESVFGLQGPGPSNLDQIYPTDSNGDPIRRSNVSDSPRSLFNR